MVKIAFRDISNAQWAQEEGLQLNSLNIPLEDDLVKSKHDKGKSKQTNPDEAIASKIEDHEEFEIDQIPLEPFWNVAGNEDLDTDDTETLMAMLELQFPDIETVADAASEFKESGRWKLAERLLVHVAETRRKELGEVHIDTLKSWAGLGTFYMQTKRYKEAEELFVKIFEVGKVTLAMESEFTLDIAAHLGYAAGFQRQYKKAEMLFAQVVESGKEFLKTEAPFVIIDTPNMGSGSETENTTFGLEASPTFSGIVVPSTSYEALKRRIKILDERVQAFRKGVPGSPSDVAGGLEVKSATSLDGIGYVEDEELHSSNVEFQSNAVDFRDVEIGYGEYPFSMEHVGNLISSYKRKGQWKKAERFLIHILSTHERVLGTEHPDTLTLMSNLATLYEEKELWEAAEKVYGKIFMLRRKVQGIADPDTVACEIKLALMTAMQGREVDKAKLRIAQAMNMMKTATEKWSNTFEAAKEALETIEAPKKTRQVHSELSSILGAWLTQGEQTKELNEPVQTQERVEPTAPEGGDPAEGPSNAGAVEQLEEPTQEPEEGTKGIIETPSDPSTELNTLSLEQMRLYQQTGQLGSLEEAIRIAERAAEVASAEEHPVLAACMTNLGIWYRMKFERTRDEDDLQMSRIWADSAMEATPKDDPEWPRRQSNISITLLTLYQQTGELELLETSVQASAEAVEAHRSASQVQQST